MSTEDRDTQPTIDIALDLRQFRKRKGDRLDQVVPRLLQRLVNMSIEQIGEAITFAGPEGPWTVALLDAHGADAINDNTRVNVVDVERHYNVRHRCKACLPRTVFGPFRCRECDDRFCERHAVFFENRVDLVHCEKDTPLCGCPHRCGERATFECERCHKPFAAHYRETLPDDVLKLLCRACFANRFEWCEDCLEGPAKNERTGRLRCAFAEAGGRPCSRRLCAYEHARQWQIWGPQHRGVVLCTRHATHLAEASLDDLWWLIVSSPPPHELPHHIRQDIFRMRNLIRAKRKVRSSWDEVEAVLQRLPERVELIEQRAKHERQLGWLSAIDKTITALRSHIDEARKLEADMLEQIREVYRRMGNSGIARMIDGVTIDRVFRRGGVRSYRISILASRDGHGDSAIGHIYGSGRKRLERLSQELKSLYTFERIDVYDAPEERP